MKYRFLPCLIFILSSISLTAQKKSNTAFAIVGSDKSKTGWMNIQEIDLTTGQVIRTIFEKGKTNFDLYDATTKKKIKTDAIAEKPGVSSISSLVVVRNTVNNITATTGKNQAYGGSSLVNYAPVEQPATIVSPGTNSKFTRYDNPTATMVAAAAFDGRQNRLYFTPLRFGELRWLDLYDRSSNLKVYCLTGQHLSADAANALDESKNITRMVIASDGNGYALSNDGNFFTRFTTGKKPVVTKLGALLDDTENNTESIHNRKHWGGDMVADADNNLYIIAASHAVFKINIKKNTASYLGLIEGLPQNYTTNGAAIDNEGNLIVSSANSAEGFYKVNLASLTSERQNITNPLASCSDLATGYFAFERPVLESAVLREKIFRSNFNIYPNPVTNGNFRVTFPVQEYGQYSVQLIDLNGRMVTQKRVTVSMKGQTEQISVDSKLASGAYLVRIINGSKKVVSSNKLLLE